MSMSVTINLAKARVVAHGHRRRMRDVEMRPHDETVARQIPGEAKQAEAARQKIREKYAVMQTDIDAAGTVEELREILKPL